jgi:hypothetical protein
MTKKAIAREWLYMLGCAFVGLVILTQFDQDTKTPWLDVIAPYVLFQLVRSIGWAITTVKAP